MPHTKVHNKPDESLLIAVVGGKRIYAKPLKPGEETSKNGDTARNREVASKNSRTIENYVK